MYCLSRASKREKKKTKNEICAALLQLIGSGQVLNDWKFYYLYHKFNGNFLSSLQTFRREKILFVRF